MRFHVAMTWMTGWMLLIGCGGGGNPDLCQDVHCEDPPADSCKDTSTLLDYPDTGTCQAATGECRYTPVEKNCADGCENGKCLGGEDDFSLEIPEDTRLCSLFQSALGNTEIQTDYAMKGRVTLKTGSISLPRDQDSFDGDLIQQVEFGPERTVLEPLTGGSFTRELQGSPDDGTYRYEYNHSFRAGDRTLQFTYRCDFMLTGGITAKTHITFDPPTTGNEWFDFSARLIDDSGHSIDERYYTGCGYPTYTWGYNHTLTMVNGDVLTMDQKMIGESICKICNTGLVHSGFTSQGQLREATDHFRLAYSAQHHNWYQNFLVVFENPLGSVFGIHVEEIDFEQPAVTVRYLDQNLEVIETVPVSDYQVTTRKHGQ